MAPVYSTQFCAAAAVNSGPYTQFIVPSGKVAVVKSMSIVWGDIAASGLDAWFQNASLAKLCRYTWAFTVSSPTNFGGTFVAWGTWVLQGGDELQVQTATGTCDMWAGGYLLDLP